MLVFKPNKDLFASTAQVLVNAVNCVGIMGKGLALAFKLRYPRNFEAYYWAVRAKRVKIGEPFVYTCQVDESPDYIVNFPTKIHWKDCSRLDYIAVGLVSLKRWLIREKITSIAIPKLGCGLGGQDWALVRRLIEKHLGDLENITIEVYGEPD